MNGCQVVGVGALRVGGEAAGRRELSCAAPHGMSGLVVAGRAVCPRQSVPDRTEPATRAICCKLPSVP